MVRWVALLLTAWLGWLWLMFVHEAGHVAAALATGGRVQRVVWYPTSLSRTDVSPNPYPTLEVAAGPLVGIAVPLIAATIVSRRFRAATIPLMNIAGFCCIANGAYLAVGSIDPVGDAKQLVALGVARSALFVCGSIAFIGGLYLWHRFHVFSIRHVTPRSTVTIGCVAIIVTMISFSLQLRD